MDVVGRSIQYDRAQRATTGKELYDRVQTGAHTLGTIQMNLSRAQWLLTNAAHNMRLAREGGTATDVVEAEVAARDALQQSANLTAHVRAAVIHLDLPL